MKYITQNFVSELSGFRTKLTSAFQMGLTQCKTVFPLFDLAVSILLKVFSLILFQATVIHVFSNPILLTSQINPNDVRLTIVLQTMDGWNRSEYIITIIFYSMLSFECHKVAQTTVRWTPHTKNMELGYKRPSPSPKKP